MSWVEERDELDDDVPEPWVDAYEELMGEEDEVDVFFILPRPDAAAAASEPLEDDEDLFVLRVVGLPENDLAWVH